MKRRSFKDKLVDLGHRVLDVIQYYVEAKAGERPLRKELDRYSLSPEEVDMLAVGVGQYRATINQQQQALQNAKIRFLGTAELAHYNEVVAQEKVGVIGSLESQLLKNIAEIDSKRIFIENQTEVIQNLESALGTAKRTNLAEVAEATMHGAYQEVRDCPVSKMLVSIDYSTNNLRLVGVNKAMLRALGYKGKSHELVGQANEIEKKDLEVLRDSRPLLEEIGKLRLPFYADHLKLISKKGEVVEMRLRVHPITLQDTNKIIGATLSTLSIKERIGLFYEHLPSVSFEHRKESDTNPRPQEA